MNMSAFYSTRTAFQPRTVQMISGTGGRPKTVAAGSVGGVSAAATPPQEPLEAAAAHQRLMYGIDGGNSSVDLNTYLCHKKSKFFYIDWSQSSLKFVFEVNFI